MTPGFLNASFLNINPIALENVAKSFESKAYEDTTAEQCANWLHAADLARSLAKTLKALEESL